MWMQHPMDHRCTGSACEGGGGNTPSPHPLMCMYDVDHTGPRTAHLWFLLWPKNVGLGQDRTWIINVSSCRETAWHYCHSRVKKYDFWNVASNSLPCFFFLAWNIFTEKKDFHFVKVNSDTKKHFMPLSRHKCLIHLYTTAKFIKVWRYSVYPLSIFLRQRKEGN